MKSVLLRSLFSAALLLGGFQLGTKYGEKKEGHFCATYAQYNAELMLDKALVLHTEDGQVLASFAYSELSNILKDERLKFHACQK